MRAFVCEEIGQVALRDVPEPEIRQPTDVIVRIRATTVCGSDLRAGVRAPAHLEVRRYEYGPVRTRESWSARFDEPGPCPYLCGPHPFMKGVVIVR